MIVRFLFLLIPFTIFSANDKPVEDAVYACLVGSYSANGIDLEKELNALEQQMVKEGILNGTSGKDKIDFYLRAMEAQDFPTLEAHEVMSVLYYFPEGFGSLGFCKDEIASNDSVAYHNSLLYTLIHNVEEIAKKTGDLNMHSIIEQLTTTLSAEDFEHPLYRAYLLLTFVMTTNRDEGYIRKLPEKHVDPETGETCDLVINISPENQIIINEFELPDEDYTIFLDSYVNSVDNDSLTFCLHFFKTTTYEAYVRARSSIDAVHDAVKSASARKKFGKYFRELTPEEREVIENMHIWKIIEKVD